MGRLFCRQCGMTFDDRDKDGMEQHLLFCAKRKFKGLKTVAQLWEEFAAGSLPQVPTTHPMYLQYKMVFYAAVQNVIAFQYWVLGDSSIPEEEGARHLESMTKETQAFLEGTVGAKKVQRYGDFGEKEQPV